MSGRTIHPVPCEAFDERPAKIAELRSVSPELPDGQPVPEITRLDIPDISGGDGAAKQTKLNIRWDATDPNEDDMNYSLRVRK